MKFIKENKEVLILLLLLVIGENLHLFFHGNNFNKAYYLIQQLGVITLIPSLFIYKKQTIKSSKAIGLAIVVWNFKELLDEFAYTFFEVNSIFTPFGNNNIFLLKILFITFITVLCYVIYYTDLWRLLSHLYSRLAPYSLQLLVMKARERILTFCLRILK